MSRSNQWPILIAGGLALVAAAWLLRRRMPADPVDEAASVAGRIIQHGQDVGPRPQGGAHERPAGTHGQASTRGLAGAHGQAEHGRSSSGGW